MKSALGENPKRVYGEQQKMPSTRLGMAAVIRSALVAAANYQSSWEPSRPSRKASANREPGPEAGSARRVLRRELPWDQHCHRADDIATALRLADEFGYDLVINHGTEAHLLADLIAARASR